MNTKQSDTKFQLGDRIRVISSDRVGHAYATITEVRRDYNPDSVYFSYKVVWDHHGFQQYSYKAEDVESVWEVVTGCPVVMTANSRTVTIPQTIDYIPIDLKVEDIQIDGECRHKWVDYQGFIENYKYCEHCDEKKT